MGVNIKFPKFTLDCGYFGFKYLRDSIAKMCPHKRLHEIIKELDDNRFSFLFDKEGEKKFYEQINKKINDMDYLANEGSSEIEKKTLEDFSEFYWACDGDAKISEKAVKAIWHYIKDCNDDFPFGYSGRKDCAHFQQFKQGIKDCLDNKKGFSWV